jgi:fructose-bisphosphate aldolase class I
LETDENVYDFQEMFCRTPELGEHLSSLIVFPEILDRTARDGTPLTELIADQGLMIGITPTTGFQLLGGSQYEYLPRGLDGLAKWRVAARVLPGLPTERAMVSNARSVAEVAALAQQFDLVPIVEPEVEMQGEHPIERQFEVSEWFLHRTFEALYEHGVSPEEIVLKTNMVVSGDSCPDQADTATVAAETIRCLRRVVPPAVPGIGFLSGGLSDMDSVANLDAMNRLGPQPWALSFSYGRAIGRAAVEAWDGKTDESKGQTALAHRARMCGLASLGEWSSDLEEAR